MQSDCANLWSDLVLVTLMSSTSWKGAEKWSINQPRSSLAYFQISQKAKLLVSSGLILNNRFLPVRPMTSRGLRLQCGNHGVRNLCSRYLVVGAGRMG